MLSYQRANQLAHILLARGVRAGELVAVCLEQSPQIVIALLGIIKTGAAYVPLDPEYPPDRLAFMLSDSGARLVLTRASLLEKLPNAGTEISWQDIDAEYTIHLGVESPSSINCSYGLAYLMYTSGSTGVPKGIAIPHRAIVRLGRNTNYVSLRVIAFPSWPVHHSMQ